MRMDQSGMLGVMYIAHIAAVNVLTGTKWIPNTCHRCVCRPIPFAIGSDAAFHRGRSARLSVPSVTPLLTQRPSYLAAWYRERGRTCH